MTQVTIDRKQALSFFSSFGKNVGDLKVTFSREGSMSATVAFISHYFHKVEAVQGKVTTPGDIDITELEKACKFLKGAKGDTVTLKQLSAGKTLYITAGSTKVQFPSSASVVSFSRVAPFERLLNDAVDSQWTKFHTSDLQIGGSVNVSDLLTVSKMRGILNASPVFKVIANAEEAEFTITAGKRHEARLFTTAGITDPVGPNAPIESSFGPWLMENIGLLKDGSAEIHFGKDTVLIFEQENDVLVIIDQRA